jgi:Na+-transporting NADH:ubiquinone oxidoreductase subunit NqrB
MAYLRDVLVSIGLCMIALFVVSTLNALIPVIRGGATGIAIVWRGLAEFLIGSVVMGWLLGTLWFVFARLLAHTPR